MKKTTKRTILFLGGVALALSIIIMPMGGEEGKPSWGVTPRGNEEGKPSWGMESSTQINL